jgi:WD40 repeat protein
MKGILMAALDMVYSVAFSPVGKLLASGSWDHAIKLWDVAP